MSERDLWTAVLLTAVEDATIGVGGSSRQNKLRMIDEARTFLTKPSEDLKIVCDGAGLNMSDVVEHMRKRIAEAPPAEELLDDVVKRKAEITARVREREQKPKRTPATYTHNSETLTLAEWSERTGIKETTIQGRLKRNWSLAEALSVSVDAANRQARQATKKTWQRGLPALTITHKGETLTVKEWSRRTGINAATIKTRLRKGMPPEKVLTVGDLRSA